MAFTPYTNTFIMARYYVVSGPAGTTTIAARTQHEARKQYKEETGRTANRVENA